MSTFSNQLSTDQVERLAMLAEECGEVIQIVGKILRHGYDSTHPDGGPSNRELLVNELCDIDAVWGAMRSRGDIKGYSYAKVKEVWVRKLRYTHHQEDYV